MTFAQLAANAAGDPQTRGFLAGLASASAVVLTLLGVLYRGFVAWAKRVQSDVRGVGDKVDAFIVKITERAEAHELEDNKRFYGVERDAHTRHEELMQNVNRHASVMTAAVSSIQVEFAEIKGRLPERRIHDRNSE